MTSPSLRFAQKSCSICLPLMLFFFSGCAELDGVFPKFNPQKKVENPTSIPSSESVTQKQILLSAENSQLQTKIEQLQQQVNELQIQQKEQRDDFLLLQEQWEMNFVLLERSVEESLRSTKASESAASMISQVLEKQPLQHNGNKLKKVPRKSLQPIENYSLLKNTETEIHKTSVSTADKELAEINNLDLKEEKIDVEEEPGFAEAGAVNLKDLEDPEDLPDPDTRALGVAPDGSDISKTSLASAEASKDSFSDPDLNPPEDPFILIRHPGVKKIYNQGMTAVIQKDHPQAILVFENFTKRFPDNLDSDNAFYWIGRSYFELNEFKKAEEAFRKVLTRYEHRPTSQGYKTPDSIYMLGKLSVKLNLEQRAVYYFEEVIKRFPGSAAARNAERDLGR
ncbi:MAG TPA: tetratricopeptide repeat protein [Candidatus Lambdaproteobacteria bacterium]|nr:tetratricopeptide repeat protein [SAR324 cluster bacterium]HIA56321.1 tetratricopeptide repeat protein [Candidatus Lambdaproteobacteria bacterium]HIB46128.1 tetratricopeptide repeat protein [Candidatus Lambdaproteobacteria bacterium]HIN47728.1 tetratricopeptide repeat protein [Deltaproteobacteria bacterium]HIO82870.1 tetratricopeptide repeat protein [Deltaproteobacteria bacterium]